MVIQLILVLIGSIAGIVGFFRFRKEKALQNWLAEYHTETLSESLQEQQDQKAQRNQQLSWLCLGIAVVLPIGWVLAIL